MKNGNATKRPAAGRQGGKMAKENLAPETGGSSHFFWNRDWVLGLLLVFATILAYQPVWHAGFIWDDDAFLTDNPVLKRADGLYRLWFTASTPDYFPMTSSMLWLEWQVWGNHPLGYHLVNVLLHAFSAVFWWRVLMRLRVPGAWLAAAIFALHPVNVESVAWITERKNTLAMFFFVLSLLWYLKFDDKGRRRCYWLAFGAFLLALLSKTAVAPLPMVLLGLAWWRRGRVEWRDVRRSVVFFILTAVLALVTIWFQSHQAIGNTVIRTDNFCSRLAGAGWAVWFYLYKAVLPVNLIFVYPRWEIDAGNMLSYVPALLLVVAFVLCWRFRRSWGRGWLFGLGYFVLMLLPILGFLNIYFMRYSLVADHWQYFAIIAPIALAAAFIRTPVPAAALLLVLGVLTWNQCRMYANVETLFRTTIDRNPACWLATENLGDGLLKKGQVDEAIVQFQQTLAIQPDDAVAYNNIGEALVQKGRVDEAIIQFQRAIAIQPDYALAHYNLGGGLLQKGQVDEAVAQLQQALAILPEFAEAHNNLGNVLLQAGKTDEAMAHFQRALASQPDYAAAHYNLGTALFQKGQVDEAIIQLQRALAIQPDYAKAHGNLGTALLQKGQLREAIIHFQKALVIQPGFVEAQNGLAHCAWMLATSPDPSIRNGTKAVELAEQTDQLSGGRNPVMAATLAAAYAEAGRFPEAITTVQRALQLATSQNNTAMVAALEAQLKLYQAGSPLRDTGTSR